MTSLKSLTGACLVAIAAIGLGGCPAMSALSFEPSKEVVQGDDGGEVTIQLFLRPGKSTIAEAETPTAELVDNAFNTAKCPAAEIIPPGQAQAEALAGSLAVAAGAQYVASLIQKKLADRVSTLERKAVVSNHAQHESSAGKLAECIGFVRTVSANTSGDLPSLLGRETLSLVVVLKKQSLGKLAYYELALAAANSTVSLTKDLGEKTPGKIDLVIGLAVTGSATKPRLHPVTHATSIKVKSLPLNGVARVLKSETAHAERGEPFPAPDGSGLRYDMVVTEVGDLGFVPKDAQADLKNFFELLGPSYEAFVQNRVITPLEN